MSRPIFDTVAIVGVGLIGGSLGMAIRERQLACRVIGIPRRTETIAAALVKGAIDDGTLELAAVADADLVVLAPPVLTIPPLVEAMAPYLRPGCIVTDVGSTKAALMETLARLLPMEVDLVGGHPMAGSHRGGVEEARSDLFEGAAYVLTRLESTRPESVERLAELARAVGARPLLMDAAQHDDAVARISHLPHVVAAALAEAVGAGQAPPDTLRQLVAGGFRDTTRIAGSPPELWRDICLSNREAILAAITDFEGALAAFRNAVEAADASELYDAFARGKVVRELLMPEALGGEAA